MSNPVQGLNIKSGEKADHRGRGRIALAEFLGLVVGNRIRRS